MRLRRDTNFPDSLVEQIETAYVKTEDVVKKPLVEFLHSGSVLLNLAASGKGVDGGWARNRIINFVGDGSSGKTLLALEACYWAFRRVRGISSALFPAVKDIQIVYNNVEGVMDFPVSEMYGEDFYEAVEWLQTVTCEEFGRDVQRRVTRLNKGQFLLYVVDSLDALIPRAAQERITKAIEQDKKTEASYGTEKAKYFSAEFFNDLCGRMKGKDATLICISQIREKIGVVFGEKYKRTGGKALDFYTHQVPWFAEVKKLKHTFRKQERVYGIEVFARLKRNKVAKPFRDVNFSILFDHGIDDIGSMVKYLYGNAEEIIWRGKTYGQEEFIKAIEDAPEIYNGVALAIEKDWQEIEEHIKPHRKPKFL